MNWKHKSWPTGVVYSFLMKKHRRDLSWMSMELKCWSFLLVSCKTCGISAILRYITWGLSSIPTCSLAEGVGYVASYSSFRKLEIQVLVLELQDFLTRFDHRMKQIIFILIFVLQVLGYPYDGDKSSLTVINFDSTPVSSLINSSRLNQESAFFESTLDTDSGDALCPRNREEAVSRGRQCLRKCKTDADCISSRKRCLCDGLCGWSCVRPGEF